MALQESGEMYLETILILESQKSNVRSIDISEYMNFSKPSVSRAVKLLKQNGYITVDKCGYIELTASGRQIADKIYDRHNILTKALTLMGVPAQIAEEDACKIEHVISDDTFNAIKNHSTEMAEKLNL